MLHHRKRLSPLAHTCLQDYERRFQVLVSDYAKLQQEHKQQASEVEVLSKVSSRNSCTIALWSSATQESCERVSGLLRFKQQYRLGSWWLA